MCTCAGTPAWLWTTRPWRWMWVGPLAPSTSRLRDGAHAQPHEHQRHGKLEPVRRGRRHFRAQPHEHGAGQNERERVAEAPPDAHQRGSREAALAADQRGHRREVIRLQGMAHAEQRSEPRACEELQDWHDWMIENGCYCSVNTGWPRWVRSSSTHVMQPHEHRRFGSERGARIAVDRGDRAALPPRGDGRQQQDSFHRGEALADT